MNNGIVKRSAAALLVAVFALAGVAIEPVAAAPTQTGPDQTCIDYIPHDLAIDVPSAAPGQTVTITGLAAPGDTVTIRIATLGGPPIVLGTAVAGPDGLFSAQITIPANFPEGTYNITVTSPSCPGAGTITIVVTFPQGRCEARVRIDARRGDTVNWDLLGILDTSKPVTVTLVPVNGGPSVVVYTGAYPASGEVTFVVPSSLPNGRYRIVESGTGPNGKPRSARCGRLRVRGGGGGGGTTTTTSSTTSTTLPGSTTTGPGSTTSTSTTSTTTSTTSTTIPGGTCEAITFTPETKLIDFDGFNPKVEYSPTMNRALTPGTWTITQATSRDGYPQRVTVRQTSEIWEIEFLDAQGNVLARSAPTPDLEDYVAFAEWTGPLGEVQLPDGVAGVRAHHLPDQVPDDPFGVANSVFAISFTICSGGGGGGSTTTAPSTTTSTTSTTQPGGGGGGSTTTSTTSTTQPGGGGGGSTTTAPGVTTTTAPGGTTTTTGNVVVPTSVLGSSVTNIGGTTPTRVAGTSTTRSSTGGSSLATTGSTVRPYIALAASLIAAGGLLVLGARRRRRSS